MLAPILTWLFCRLTFAAVTLASAILVMSTAAVASDWLSALTAPEVAARQRAGVRTVLIPTGGFEQNGAHLTLDKHQITVAAVAEGIARALPGQMLIAPVVAFVPEGPPDQRVGHMAFPGTLSLRPATFEALLTDLVTSLQTHGFTEVLLLGDSGGNIAPMRAVAARSSQPGRRVRALVGAYDTTAQVDFLRTQGLDDVQIGTHAGVRETSELLHLAPSAVRMNHLSTRTSGSDGTPALARADWGATLVRLKVEAALADLAAQRQQAP